MTHMYSATSRALNAYHNIGVETGVAAASPVVPAKQEVPR